MKLKQFKNEMRYFFESCDETVRDFKYLGDRTFYKCEGVGYGLAELAYELPKWRMISRFVLYLAADKIREDDNKIYSRGWTDCFYDMM